MKYGLDFSKQVTHPLPLLLPGLTEEEMGVYPLSLIAGPSDWPLVSLNDTYLQSNHILWVIPKGMAGSAEHASWQGVLS